MHTSVIVKEEIVSPGEFIKIRESERGNIKRTSIIPPSPGGRDFGRLKVEYKIGIIKPGRLRRQGQE